MISASLGKGRHIQLSQPIRLILKHLQTDNVTNPSCVFWNYIDQYVANDTFPHFFRISFNSFALLLFLLLFSEKKKNSAWSEDGCHIEQTNRTHTICMCNHLTNFAILMDVIDDTAQFIQQIGLIDENMRILISISIAICIIFIVIALLTLKLFNGIFIKVRTEQQNNNGSNPLHTQTTTTTATSTNRLDDQSNLNCIIERNNFIQSQLQGTSQQANNLQSFELCEYSPQTSSIYCSKLNNFINYEPQASQLQMTQQQNLMPNNVCQSNAQFSLNRTVLIILLILFINALSLVIAIVIFKIALH